jgi:hypothetical protein
LNFGNEKELSFKFYRKYSTLHYHFKSREYVIKVCDCYSGNILRLLRSNFGFTARSFAIILKYSKMSQNQCLSGKYSMTTFTLYLNCPSISILHYACTKCSDYNHDVRCGKDFS